jgi:cob(I)alamin adenosyltransferase
MKIYTRTGDKGTTGLFGGDRVSKTHPRVQLLGTLDELNAVLGIACSCCAHHELCQDLERIQARLLALGADIATRPGTPAERHIGRASPQWATELEAQIDAMEAKLPPLHRFVLPGGSLAAAVLHYGRAVSRRAERDLVAAREAGEEMGTEAEVFLNRLADWLFVAARTANAEDGVPDRPLPRQRNDG